MKPKHLFLLLLNQKFRTHIKLKRVFKVCGVILTGFGYHPLGFNDLKGHGSQNRALMV